MESRQYKIFVLEFGRTLDQPIGNALYGAYNSGVAPMPYGFVAAHDGNRVVLVDAGFEERGSGGKMKTAFRVKPYVSPSSVLERIGIGSSDVTDVIFTHAHYDHIGSIHSFPNARFYLQREELEQWKWALGKGKRFASLTAPCNPDDLAKADELVASGRMKLLDGDVENLLPGITVKAAPQSHTFMHQFAVFEKTSRGRLIAAGDLAFSRKNFPNEENGGSFVAPGFGVGSQIGMLLALEQIWDLASHDLERIIIVHEPLTYTGRNVTTEDEGMRIVELA